MTDEAKALVERLRLRKTLSERIEALETQLECANEALRERLDICETQAREIEWLREALGVIRDGDYPYKQASQYARAALAGDSHD